MDTKDKLIKWFLQGETGVSSEAIVAQMIGINTETLWDDHPHDNGDFGRCYRLLKEIPEFRAKIAMMRERSEQWAALVNCWDELELLHETDGAACNARMKKALTTAKDSIEAK